MATIEFRGINKRTGEHVYRITISDGYDASQKQIRIRRTYSYSGKMTEKARQKAIDDDVALLTAQHIKHEIVSAKQYTVQGLSELFMSEHVTQKLKVKTQFEYRRQLNVINRYIGRIKLHQFTALDLQRMYKRMKQDGIPVPTLAHYHAVLSSMFTRAIFWQLITDNPCRRVESPSGDASKSAVKRKRKIKYFTIAQAQQFCEYLQHEPIKYRLGILLALLAGLRRSEINGLEWRDINFDTGTIHIARQSNYTPDDGIYEDDPKTDDGDRIIEPPTNIMELLKEYRKEWQQLSRAFSSNLVHPDRLFTKENGEPIFPDTIAGHYRKVLIRMREKQKLDIIEARAEKAGCTVGEMAISIDPKEIEPLILPIIRFHDLRHTCGTLRKALGESTEAVGAYLGHADKSSTEIYIHALVDQQKKYSEQMAQLLS